MANPGKIDVLLKSWNKKVEFTVRDNGIGIPQNKMDLIFKPFCQLARERNYGKGIGLGLYIVKKIVDEVKGKIQVTSGIDKGTELTILFERYFPQKTGEHVNLHPGQYPQKISQPFILPAGQYSEKTHKYSNTLPYSLPINIEKNDFLNTEQPHPDRINVLYVDDNEKILSYMQKYFIKRYNFFSAKNGKHALRKLRSIPKPDIIVSDIIMDEMDGYTFYDQIYKDELYRDIPFIFITGKNTEKEKIRALEKGAIDFIPKPFLVDELILKINALISNKKNQKVRNIKELKDRVLKVFRIDPTMEVEKNPDEDFVKYGITKRERDVIELIVRGKTNKEISADLFISPGTVRKHVENIFRKCNVNTRTELSSIFPVKGKK